MGERVLEVRARRDVPAGGPGGPQPQRHHPDHGEPAAGDEEPGGLRQDRVVRGREGRPWGRLGRPGPVRDLRRDVGGVPERGVLRAHRQRRQDRQDPHGVGGFRGRGASRRGGPEEPVLRVRGRSGGLRHRGRVLHQIEVLRHRRFHHRERPRGVRAVAARGQAHRGEDGLVRAGDPRRREGRQGRHGRHQEERVPRMALGRHRQGPAPGDRALHKVSGRDGGPPRRRFRTRPSTCGRGAGRSWPRRRPTPRCGRGPLPRGRASRASTARRRRSSTPARSRC